MQYYYLCFGSDNLPCPCKSRDPDSKELYNIKINYL